MASVSPYLDAIQAIEGNTPRAKYETIIKQIKTRIKNLAKGEQIDEIVWDKEGHLQPLYEIIVGNMTKNHNLITKSLKSEDLTIVSRALKCKWYFSDKNKNFIGPKEFFDKIIPFVTLKTRGEIVKSLGLYLSKPNTAEKFYDAMFKNYGHKQSMPLLYACSDQFVRNKIIEHKIIFRINQINKMYKRKPEVVTYYLELLCNDPKYGFLSEVSVEKYEQFLPKLIEKNHICFYHLYKSYYFEKSYYNSRLLPMKELYIKQIIQKNILKEDPLVYLDLVPVKMIDVRTMTDIFPKLLPKDVNKFNTNKILRYLEYYPPDKKYTLLNKSYKTLYKRELLDDHHNITFELIPYLPEEIRTSVVLELMSKCKNKPKLNEYKINYNCYLPASDNIERIKDTINRTESMQDRVLLVIQMVYNCKVTNDSGTLCTFLSYINKRHKHEIPLFWDTFFRKFSEIYNYSELKANEWKYIDAIIKNIYVQDNLFRITSHDILLKESIVSKFNDLSISPSKLDEMITIYFDMMRIYCNYDWCRYDGKPDDEVRFFTTMMSYAEKKCAVSRISSPSVPYDSHSSPNPSPEKVLSPNQTAENVLNLSAKSGSGLNRSTEVAEVLDEVVPLDPNESLESKSDSDISTLWNNRVKINFIAGLVKTMYYLDEKYCTCTKDGIKKKQLLSRPFQKWRSEWLYQQVENILTSKEKLDASSRNFVTSIEDYVKKGDPEMYVKLVGPETEKSGINFSLGEPFKMLKSDPRKVLRNLKLFMDSIETSRNFGKVKHFFLTCRWYQNIPIKFVEEARKRLSENRLFYLYLLAFILHGKSYKNFVAEYVADRITYSHELATNKLMTDMLTSALKGMMVSNPPIPFEIINNFFNYKYQVNILSVLTNASNRTTLEKIRIYLRTITDKRVAVRITAIRIFCMIETIDNCAEKFITEWKLAEQGSLRQVLFRQVYALFYDDPRDVSWHALKLCIGTYRKTDWDYPPSAIPTNRIPERYINELVRLIIQMGANVIQGVEGNQMSKGIDFLKRTLLDLLHDSTADLLNERICSNLIEAYMFNKLFASSRFMILFVLNKYLLLNENKYPSRIKTFQDIYERNNYQWRTPELKNQIFHPVRYVIVKLVEELVDILLNRSCRMTKSNNTCGRIIDDMIRIFFTLPVYNDVKSYALLQLTKFFITSENEYIDKFCNITVKACETGNCDYRLLVETIEYFVSITSVSTNNFISGLLKNQGCTYSGMIAVSLLSVPECTDEFKEYYETLGKIKAYQDPEVLSLLYDKINRINYYPFYDESYSSVD